MPMQVRVFSLATQTIAAVVCFYAAGTCRHLQEIAKALGLFAAGCIFRCTCGDIMALQRGADRMAAIMEISVVMFSCS
ncbi:unnamed protein product [Urochloa humidicola]